MKILNTPYTIRTQTFYGIVAWQVRRSGFFFSEYTFLLMLPCAMLPAYFIYLFIGFNFFIF